jgi:endonuclease/exonuclease/phosphatase (EEP) superfamily protein YafD
VPIEGVRSELSFDRSSRELADHRGPVIVAGDLNTWSSARLAVVDDVSIPSLDRARASDLSRT